MTFEKLRAPYDVEPSQPFALHLADGRKISGLHREFMMAAPSGRTVVVMQPDDTMNIIDLPLVTGVELKLSNGTHRRKKS